MNQFTGRGGPGYVDVLRLASAAGGDGLQARGRDTES